MNYVLTKNTKEKNLWILIIILILIFIISKYFNQFLMEIIGVLFIFFIPGFLILKNENNFIKILFSPVVSLILLISLTLFLNIVFRVEIDDIFLDKLFLVSLPVVYVFRRFQYKKSSEKMSNNIFLFLFLIILFCIVIRSLIILKIGTLIGTDVTKFATISHVFKLKGEITPDLRPYFPSSSFFAYSPVSIIIPLFFDILGIDTITGITLLSFLFDILSILAFFAFVREFVDNSHSLYATFFYSIFFDLSFIYLMSRGLFSFANGFYPLYLSFLILIKLFKKEKLHFLPFFVFPFVLLSHPLDILAFITFFFSIIIYETVTSNKFSIGKRIFFDVIKAILITIILTSPYLFIFLPYVGDAQKIEKLADLKMNEVGIEKLSILQKIQGVIFSDGATLFQTILYPLGFIITLLFLNKFFYDKKLILLLFFVFTLISSMFYMNSVFFRRSIDFPKIIYPVSFSLAFNNPIFTAISLVSSPFLSNTPVWFYLNLPFNNEYSSYYDVVTKDEIDAFEFIKNNVPLNSTFLLDGGGSGGIEGHIFSHGERIFPLTSRKILYNSGLMEISDYQNMIEIYSKVAIDPNNEGNLMLLRKFNVTHVYIGPKSVGLNLNLFLNSKNYKLIFNEGEVFVFEIK
jgi:hypothetical protein